jgi:hypothetical protein
MVTKEGARFYHSDGQYALKRELGLKRRFLHHLDDLVDFIPNMDDLVSRILRANMALLNFFCYECEFCFKFLKLF